MVITATVTLTLHCRHCNRQFVAQRSSAKYCSNACKAKTFRGNRAGDGKATSLKKANRLDEKLKKLARSNYGRWLVGQLKRAGTVQALQGATADDLKALAELKAACDKANAYKIGSYEISHKYPVDGQQGIGRLLPSNLVIAPRSFNRRRGKNSPDDPDGLLHLSYGDIRFKLMGKETSIGILKKLQGLLGPEFNTWLKSHQVKQSHRDALAKKLRTSNPRLKVPAAASIDELKAIADKAKVSYFEIRASEATPEWVAFEQLKKAGLQSHPVYQALERSPEVNVLGHEPPPLPDGFWAFVVEQAMLLLHGEEAQTEFEGKPLLDYFPVERHSASSQSDMDDMIL